MNVIQGSIENLSKDQIWEALFECSNDLVFLIDLTADMVVYGNRATEKFGKFDGSCFLNELVVADSSVDNIRLTNAYKSKKTFESKSGFRLNSKVKDRIPVDIEFRPIEAGESNFAILVCKPIKAPVANGDDPAFPEFGVPLVDPSTDVLLIKDKQSGREFKEVDGDAVFWVRENGEIIYVNEEATRSLQYSQKELCSMKVFDVNPLVTENSLPTIWAQLSKQRINRYESVHRRKDGTYIDVEINSTLAEIDGAEIGIALARDVTNRKATDKALTSILAGTARAVGEDFYQSLVEHVAKSLDFKCTIIAEIVGQQDQLRARTLAIWDTDRLVPNLEYPLVGTPCEHVYTSKTCCFPEQVQELFPDDEFLVEMGVQSYIGTVLHTVEGKVTGLLIALDERPRKNISALESLLEVFAYRASAELERGQQQKKLKREEAKFRALAESNPGLVGICVDFEHVYANPAFRYLLGYDPHEIIGTSLLDYVHPDFQELVAEHYVFWTCQDEVNKRCEVKLIHKDGRELWFEIGGKLIEIDGMSALMVIALDTNERKQSELALAANERKLAAIAESMPHAMCVFDIVDHRTIYSNRQDWHSLGYSDSQLPSDSEPAMFEFMHPQDLQRLAELKQRWNLAKDGQVLETEYRMKHSDGSWRWFRGRDSVHRRNENGQVVEIIRTIEDITESRALENKLTRFREMLNQASESIIVVEAENGQIRDVNGTACKSLGYTKEELLSMSVLDIQERFRKSPQANWKTHIDQLRKTGSKMFYGQHVRKDGTKYPVELALTIKKFDGCEYVIGFARNISERVAAEKALKLSEKRLKEREIQLAHVGRLSIMGETVAGIAHEVSQPLCAIANYSKATILELERQSATTEELNARFKKIDDLAMAAGDILKRAGKFTRKGTPTFTRIDIRDAIKESIELLKFEIRKHNVHVKIDGMENRLFVDAISIQIQQVMTNLLKNAIESMECCDPGSRILKISLQEFPNELQVNVIDNGHGIHESDVEEIFEAFHSTKENGIGIGLAICRTIIQEHRGKIWASENSAGGATVSFTMPIADAED